MSMRSKVRPSGALFKLTLAALAAGTLCGSARGVETGNTLSGSGFKGVLHRQLGATGRVREQSGGSLQAQRLQPFQDHAGGNGHRPRRRVADLRVIAVAVRGLLSTDNQAELQAIQLPGGGTLEFILAVPGRRYADFVDLLAPFHAEHCAGAKKELIGEVAWEKLRLIVAHDPDVAAQTSASAMASSPSLKKGGRVDQYPRSPRWRQAQARPQTLGRRRPRPLLSGSVRRTSGAHHPRSISRATCSHTPSTSARSRMRA